MKFSRLALIAAGLLIGASSAHAVISFNGTTYTQNFDSLASAPTTANVTSIAWANDSTLAGWSLFVQPAPGTAPTTYIAGNGSSNAGSFYSYGSAASTDRALGGLGSGGAYFGSPVPASGAVAGWIALALTNASGSDYDNFTVAFNGEQWRNGGTTTSVNPVAQTMVLQYGFGSTFSSVGTWNTPGGSFEFTSPVITNAGTGAAVDGNVAGLVTGLGGTINTTWSAGQTLWIRWVENNDVNNDHGLAIDNFSLSVAAVPEPETYAMLLAGLGLLGFVARRRIK
jgi:hypothetical protein